MLRRKEILERANSLNAVPLDYGINTRLVKIENQFQVERRDNPVLEETPPEAWIASVLLDDIRQIRANVVIPDRTLSDAVQKYLRRRFPLIEARADHDEQKLVTTIQPFLPAVQSLLDEIFDRGKSIFGILGLRVSSGSIRRIVRATPKSQREKLIVRGINEGWSNSRLGRELTDAGIRPKNRRWKTYVEFQHQEPQQFSVIKSTVKRKYLASRADLNLEI